MKRADDDAVEALPAAPEPVREHARATADRRTALAAWVALAWVVLFFTFHVYWYAGGTFGSPGELPGLPDSWSGWLFDVLVGAAFPLGAWACLAIARGWAHGWSARSAVTLVWIGCLLLLVRGAAGVIDDLVRVTGLLPNGLTGLSIQETTGMADPSAYTLWSGRAIDGYFLLGGIAFGVLAVRYRTNLRDRAPR